MSDLVRAMTLVHLVSFTRSPTIHLPVAPVEPATIATKDSFEVFSLNFESIVEIFHTIYGGRFFLFINTKFSLMPDLIPFSSSEAAMIKKMALDCLKEERLKQVRFQVRVPITSNSNPTNSHRV